MAKRAVPEVNAGSMADIAFLLLIFFLMTTTMDTDTGLARLLPPPVPLDQEPPPPLNERNVFVVLLNSKNQLLVEGEQLQISQLKDKVKEFIDNPLELANFSDKKESDDLPYFGIVPISKGVISLQNDRGTQYQAYLTVQNELQAAYSELRDDKARQKFRKAFKDLKPDEQDAIKEIYPQRISEAEPKNVGVQ